MGYSLSFAGVSLPLSTPELEAHLAHLLPSNDFTTLDQWQFNGFGLQQLPTPNLPTFPDVEIGVLRWPTGAARPATAYFVVNGTKLAQIRSVIGTANTPQPLVMSDSRLGFSVTASMYMLPPRPLNQVYGGGSAQDGWLLTLVDRRFYDFWKRGVITQPATWDDLFDQIGDILGTVIFQDAVSSAYGVPSSKWVQQYQPTTTILDAAAAQVGQVVVYGLDGSITTKNYPTANTESDAQTANLVAQVGGVVLDSDIARYVPASVNVLFGVSTDTSTAHVVSKTLVSLGMTQYTPFTGVPNTQGTTFADVLYDGTNTTAVNSYATQAATDWYGWRLPNLDVSAPGIFPWVPTGWEDAIEWRYQRHSDTPYADTRIRRGQWDQLPSGTWWAGVVPIPSNWVPGGGSGSGSGSGGAGCLEPVTVECRNGVRTLTTKDIKVGIVGNQLVLEECSQNDTVLGPCSPVTPDGTTLPVVTLVCPTFTTLNYLDHDSAPQTVDVVTSLTVQRRLVTVPVSGPEGCIVDPETCCDGSGSGSGGIGCTDECDQCSTMSQSWTLHVADREPVSLHRVENPNDGNRCRFVSADLVWDLYFDYESELWLLVNYDTEELWYLNGDDWVCQDDNILHPDGDGENALVSPDEVCISWNCIDGICTPVAGDGGTYPTHNDCLAVCGGVDTECCPDDQFPQLVNATFGTSTGPSLTCLNDLTIPLPYLPTDLKWSNQNGAGTGGIGITCVSLLDGLSHDDWILDFYCVLGTWQMRVWRYVNYPDIQDQLCIGNETSSDCPTHTVELELATDIFDPDPSTITVTVS